MVPQIRVDDEVYQYLKIHAEPFVDTPNTVLRRELGLDGARTDSETSSGSGIDSAAPTRHGHASGRAKTGELLRIETYYEPILRSLVERGGSARVADVLDDVGRELAHQLTSVDRLAIRSGGKRWRNRVQWARLHLVEQGLLERKTPHGTWAITNEGRNKIDASA